MKNCRTANIKRDNWAGRISFMLFLLVNLSSATIIFAQLQSSAPKESSRRIVSADDEDGDKKKKKKKREKDEDDEDGSHGTRVKGARPVPSFTVPRAVDGTRYAYFIAMGDWGKGNRGQKQVADLMSAKAGRDSLHFVLTLGDNFYDSGVSSANDPQWQKKFELMYNLPSLNVPFFASLGNHDHKKPQSPAAQVEYSKKSTKWRLPDQYYTFTRSLGGNANIQFFALDTDVLREKKWYDFSDDNQLKWLESELTQSTAAWKVVFGHHPIFSNGKHGDTPGMKKFVQPLLEKYKVDFFLCGHDHDRQLIKPVNGVNYVVSGTAAESRDTTWGSNAIFAASDLGFVWCRVSAAEFHVQFINQNGEIEFAYTVHKAGSGGKAADQE